MATAQVFGGIVILIKQVLGSNNKVSAVPKAKEYMPELLVSVDLSTVSVDPLPHRSSTGACGITPCVPPAGRTELAQIGVPPISTSPMVRPLIIRAWDGIANIDREESDYH